MIRAAALAATLATPVAADVRCAPAHVMLPALSERYGEAPVFEGTNAAGWRVWVFLNRTTGTWTVVGVDAVQACILSAGSLGRTFDLPPEGEPT